MSGISKQYLRNNYEISKEFFQGDFKSDAKWPTYGEMPPGGPPKNPKWPSRLPKWCQGLPKLPKVTLPAPKMSPRSPKVTQRWSQVVPRGLPRPPKIDQKRSPRPSRDTFKKMNLSMLREPHYLLCFWSSLLREPHYLLCFKHIWKPNFPQKWWKRSACHAFKASGRTCLSKGTGSAFIF